MIKDQYTGSSHSRQRRYQLRHQAQGLCIYCSEPAVMGSHCLRHAIKVREMMRKRKKCRKRFFSRSYKLEHEEKMRKRMLRAMKAKIEEMKNNGQH
jgi:hypothetical protein